MVGSCSNGNLTDEDGVTLVGVTVKVDSFSLAENQNMVYLQYTLTVTVFEYICCLSTKCARVFLCYSPPFTRGVKIITVFPTVVTKSTNPATVLVTYLTPRS